MTTVADGALFNSLAYCVTGYDANGQPVYSPDTPQALQALPEGWQVKDVQSGPGGQTDVLFYNSTTNEAYIAVRGTTASLNDAVADVQILVGSNPQTQDNALVAYYNV
jgi:hypothetical protein